MSVVDGTLIENTTYISVIFMKKRSLGLLLFSLSIAFLVTTASASTQGEINYLLRYGKKILIEGDRAGDQRWDKACRLRRKSSYVAIVQSDGANYRIVPVPGGKVIEKVCPPNIFRDALQWYEKLHYRRE